MNLKNIVDDVLKDKGRSMSWLSKQMGRTFDGLKLSLVNETIKYKDLQTMSKALNVVPDIFFKVEGASYLNDEDSLLLSEEDVKYNDLKGNLKNCREMVSSLKDQLKDKDKIISLLGKA